jgi:DNA (cytosine-5)-methyltransferase 1
LGSQDERDLFPQALRLIEQCKPEAVMLENVRGLLSPKFDEYRRTIERKLRRMGYVPDWQLVHAADFGVPQLRPRSILVALRPEAAMHFRWPDTDRANAPSVGDALHDLMSANGWSAANEWRKMADGIGPTLVGGSKKHGGPDLGPTRARAQWAQLGVDGRGVADHAPHKDFDGSPRLTVRMAARIQGFPDEWEFAGRKTASYRQIGNAFPPPVARAIGVEIARALRLAAGEPSVVRQAVAA